jgi:5'/3'-nucleotidase SurE
MKILLTNDDGYLSNEIQTLKRALRDAGHRVILVAPVSNQSWGGTTLQASANKAKLVERGMDEYSLECEDVIFKSTGEPWPASPAQCYIVGEEIFPDFDLLISGMNIGQNTDGSPLFSGTIGAVHAAISRVIGNKSHPAIGISLGEFANINRVNEAAQIVVNLLENYNFKKLLSPGIGLNINIPGGYPNGEDTLENSCARPYFSQSSLIEKSKNPQKENTKQIEIIGTSVNRAGGVYNIPGIGDDYFHVLNREGNIFTLGDAYRTPIKDIPYSDNTSLNQGYVTIVPIVADTTANINSFKFICKHLKKIDKSICCNLNTLKYSVASEIKFVNK